MRQLQILSRSVFYMNTIHVFWLEAAYRFTVDLDISRALVEDLTAAITALLKITSDNQMLFINGGKALIVGQRLSSYCAGTDSSPIFLVSKTNVRSSVGISQIESLDLDEIMTLFITRPSSFFDARNGSSTDSLCGPSDMRDRVQAAMKLSPGYQTLVARVQLAISLSEHATECLEFADQVLQRHVLQNLGWMAAVLYFEDVVKVFRSECEKRFESVDKISGKLEKCEEALQSYEKALPLLQQTVIPKMLISERKTLYDWLEGGQSSNQLSLIYTDLRERLKAVDIDIRDLTRRRSEVTSLLAALPDLHQYMEIGGLKEKLKVLNYNLKTMEKLVDEQNGLKGSFENNQRRLPAGDTGTAEDREIVTHFCQSHVTQLGKMGEIQDKLQTFRDHFAKAETQLCQNLQQRLLSLIDFVDKASRILTDVTVKHAHMIRLVQNLNILPQVTLAAPVLVRSLDEVARRRQFADKFTQFCRECFSSIHRLTADENARRKQFAVQVDRNFVLSLFPANCWEMVPELAPNTVPKLDNHLPPIKSSDCDALLQEAPALAEAAAGWRDSCCSVSTPALVDASLRPLLDDALAIVDSLPHSFFAQAAPTLDKSQKLQLLLAQFVCSVRSPPNKVDIADFQQQTDAVTADATPNIQSQEVQTEPVSVGADTVAPTAECSSQTNNPDVASTATLTEETQQSAEVEGAQKQADEEQTATTSMYLSSIELPAVVASSSDAASEKPPNSPRTPAAPVAGGGSGLHVGASPAVGLSRSDYITIGKVKEDELVLLVFDAKIRQYVVFNRNQDSYILHHKCVPQLTAGCDAASAQGGYFIARVKKLQRVKATKENNRFGLPMGKEFYRIWAEKDQ